jgi:hypothetical protein
VSAQYAADGSVTPRLRDPHRIGAMLNEEDPLYPNWDQDASAIAERYEE